MKVTPLGDRILVERIEAEAKTAGGIVLPDSAREKPQQGSLTADSYEADEYDLYVLRRAGDLAPHERERIALILGDAR